MIPIDTDSVERLCSTLFRPGHDFNAKKGRHSAGSLSPQPETVKKIPGLAPAMIFRKNDFLKLFDKSADMADFL